MKIKFSLIRDHITATSLTMETCQISTMHRWILSSLRMSGKDASKYHLIGLSETMDLSSTDYLEEVTAGVTGQAYDIVNAREQTGSYTEVDLEPVTSIPHEP